MDFSPENKRHHPAPCVGWCRHGLLYKTLLPELMKRGLKGLDHSLGLPVDGAARKERSFLEGASVLPAHISQETPAPLNIHQYAL